jgi:hypothetical protein
VQTSVSGNGFYIVIGFRAGGRMTRTERYVELAPSEALELLRQLSFVLTERAVNDVEAEKRAELG